MLGCATAYFAAQAGHKVVITKMRDVALGASSRNAGFMITGLDTYYHDAIALWARSRARSMGYFGQNPRLLAQFHQGWQRAPREVRLQVAGRKRR
ncbi:MAG: FAD-binding oxidoreductase [Ktedonobacterales bacterium]|nr:FAD-binding oxidoreductase [Ktedonobacterales bacterium]